MNVKELFEKMALDVDEHRDVQGNRADAHPQYGDPIINPILATFFASIWVF